MAQELHVFTPDEAHTDALRGIKAFLERKAQEDAVFALKYITSGKTLIGAVRYLAHKNLDNVVLKGEKAGGKTFDFAMNSDDADNELAAAYFMDDTLDYEKGAEPTKTEPQKKVRTTKAVKPAKSQKTAKANTSNSSPITPNSNSNVKPSTQPRNDAKPSASKPAVTFSDEIDLFDGLFD